jgi:hypothetical protein
LIFPVIEVVCRQPPGPLPLPCVEEAGVGLGRRCGRLALALYHYRVWRRRGRPRKAGRLALALYHYRVWRRRG